MRVQPDVFQIPQAEPQRSSSGFEVSGLHDTSPVESHLSLREGRHLFVDNVRFWCMLTVVATHCTGIFGVFGDEKQAFSDIAVTWLKFGTIGFFLISGFLLGKGMETSTPVAYFWRRCRKVFLPWLLWYSVMAGLLMTMDLVHHRIHLLPAMPFLHLLKARLVYCLFGSAFWFVPNLLLSLGILLLFRRYVDRLWFGGALFALDLFYVVNLYTRWVSASHTEAMLGFVFYLWLGIYLYRHRLRFEQWAATIPMPALIAVTALAATAAYGETILLESLNLNHALSTLRLSNQIFSVCAVLVLFKMKGVLSPPWVDVPRNTFGIYLIHSPFLLIVWSSGKIHLLQVIALFFLATNVGTFLLWLAFTAATYLFCLGLTKVIASQGWLSWMVGVEAPARVRAEPKLASSFLAASEGVQVIS